MATEQITTTYNELEKLGACKEGLATLLEWCKKHPENNGSYKQLRLTPADILESNGLSHLYWATSVVPSWNKSWQAWFVSAGGGISGWAKEVSQPCEKKVLPTELKAAEFRTGGEIKHGGLVLAFDTWPSGLADGTKVEIVVTPKREPRRLKAEQILVAENVGTKWVCLESKQTHVYKVESDMGDGEPRYVLMHENNRRPASVTNYIFSDTWEEVLD